MQKNPDVSKFTHSELAEYQDNSLSNIFEVYPSSFLVHYQSRSNSSDYFSEWTACFAS